MMRRVDFSTSQGGTGLRPVPSGVTPEGRGAACAMRPARPRVGRDARLNRPEAGATHE